MNNEFGRFDLVVIGGGPGGIAAAREAGRLGASVALIEADRVGGRANWHSLLPSKVWLSAADRLGTRAHDALLGLDPADGGIDSAAVTARIAELSRSNGQRYRDELQALGVHLTEGRAVLEDEHTVCVGEDRLWAEFLGVATGSGPIFFPDLKPDGERIIAPRHMGGLETVPDSILLVGGGVTGAEFAYLFNRIGSQVTWLVDQYGVLPRSDRDIAGALTDALTARGVQLVEGMATQSLSGDGEQVTAILRDGRTFTAAYAFIAIGRRPDTRELNLEAAGVAMRENGAILTDGFQQSSVPHVYAIGDAAGSPMIANRAVAQGRIAARHALGQPAAAFRAETVVEAVYTDPQVAQVGLTEARAADLGQRFEAARVNVGGNLKAQLVGQTEGFLKLLFEPRSGRLLGGAAAGPHAADLMAPLAVALSRGASLDDLATAYAGYPTLSELPLEATRALTEGIR